MSDKTEKSSIKPLPIGYDDFAQIIREGMHFVDKSLGIKELVDSPVQVSLITRPRRFGKSLFLSMLQHFFASEVLRKPTKELFWQLNIAKAGERYMREQGRYPVIYLTLKGVTGPSFEEACADLGGVFSRAYTTHEYLLDSPHLSDANKTCFLKVLQRTESVELLKESLLNLSTYLYRHYGEKAVILIDEYDAPIQTAYRHDFYAEMIDFMRSLFGNALKNNPCLHRAVLTGILRVSKESLFSGLNNLDVYSIFRPEYSEYFGFTETEVTDLFTERGLAVELKAVRDWYNGYQMGDTLIYNPWSIVNCIHRKGLLEPYWVNTGGYDILKRAMAKADAEFKMSMESLLAGEPVQRLVDENFVFGDLENNETALWSLLLASGYLKTIRSVPEEGFMNCALLFPNYEVTIVYKNMFKEWFRDKLDQDRYKRFLEDFLNGQIEDFMDTLKDYLFESASLFDVKGIHPEKFYHGFVLGLIASLQDRYVIKSNRESGHGRYDLMIMPKDKTKLGIVLEFKTARATENLGMIAQEALQQVKDKQYEVELKQAGISSVLKLGLAFKGKEVECVYE